MSVVEILEVVGVLAMTLAVVFIVPIFIGLHMLVFDKKGRAQEKERRERRAGWAARNEANRIRNEANRIKYMPLQEKWPLLGPRTPYPELTQEQWAEMRSFFGALAGGVCEEPGCEEAERLQPHHTNYDPCGQEVNFFRLYGVKVIEMLCRRHHLSRHPDKDPNATIHSVLRPPALRVTP